MDSPKKIYCNPSSAQHNIQDILQKIKKERNRPLFALCGTGSIGFSTVDQVYSWKKEIKEVTKEAELDIIIDSPGGNLSACYTIARILCRWCNRWEALVPDVAASGATLICLGSSNIIMSEVAQLSPLDPQVVSKRTGKFFEDERQSPLEAFQATKYMRDFALTALDLFMDFLADRKVNPRLALDTSCRLAVDLAKPILGKIEPYDLGAFALDSKVAIEYCKRIGSPINEEKRTQRNVDPTALVEKYPAHEFVIDMEEAKALNFVVSDPEPAIDQLFTDLRPHLMKPKRFLGLIS